MGQLADDIFVPPSAVGHDADEVGLGAACSENSCLKTKQLGTIVFQSGDCWVVPVDIIAYFGLGHGLAHCPCGLGDGVAAQVDSFAHLFSSVVP